MKHLWNRRKYWNLARDRKLDELTPEEEQFMAHFCEEFPLDSLAHDEEEEAMNFLRGNSLNLTPSENFNTKIIRSFRVDRAKQEFKYWAPAVVGASLASFALMAILQLLVHSGEFQHLMAPGASEAKRYETRPVLIDTPQPGPRTQ